MNNKYKNPYFWLSVFAMIFTASGIEFNNLTSWNLLYDALCNIISNPVSLVAISIQFLGIWNDNGTKGLDKFK